MPINPTHPTAPPPDQFGVTNHDTAPVLSASPIDGAANTITYVTNQRRNNNETSTSDATRCVSASGMVATGDRGGRSIGSDLGQGSVPSGSGGDQSDTVLGLTDSRLTATRAAAHIALYRTRLMLAEVWRGRFDTRHYPAFRAYALARVRLARAAIA